MNLRKAKIYILSALTFLAFNLPMANAGQIKCDSQINELESQAPKFNEIFAALALERNILYFKSNPNTRSCVCNKTYQLMLKTKHKMPYFEREVYRTICLERRSNHQVLRSVQKSITAVEKNMLQKQIASDDFFQSIYGSEAILRGLSTPGPFLIPPNRYIKFRATKVDPDLIPSINSSVANYSEIIFRQQAIKNPMDEFSDTVKRIIQNTHGVPDEAFVTALRNELASKISRTESILFQLNNLSKQGVNTIKSENLGTTVNASGESAVESNHRSTTLASSSYSPICVSKCSASVDVPYLGNFSAQNPICKEKENICQKTGGESDSNSGNNLISSNVLYDECVIQYRADFKPGAPKVDVKNLGVVIPMHAVDHCIRIKTSGPIAVDEAIKKHVEYCGNKAVNDAGVTAAVGTLVSGGVTAITGPGGATLFATTVKKIVTVAAGSFLDCVKSVDRLTDKLKDQLVDQFKSSISDETKDVDWDLVSASGAEADRLIRRMLERPDETIEELTRIPFNDFERNLPGPLREAFKDARDSLDREVKSAVSEVRKQAENIVGEQGTAALNKFSEETQKVLSGLVEQTKKTLQPITKPVENFFDGLKKVLGL